MRKKVIEPICVIWYCFFPNGSLQQTCAMNPLPYPHRLYLLADLYFSFKIQAKEFKFNFVSMESPRRFLSRDLTM